MGACSLHRRGCSICDRVYPNKPGDHLPERLRATFKLSLEKLAPYKARVLYLHAPDRTVPFEDALREVNALYTEVIPAAPLGTPVQIGVSIDLASGVKSLGPASDIYQQSSMRTPNSPGM